MDRDSKIKLGMGVGLGLMALPLLTPAQRDGRRAGSASGRIIGRIRTVRGTGRTVVAAEIESKNNALRTVFAAAGTSSGARLLEYAGGAVWVQVHVVKRGDRWWAESVQPTHERFQDFMYRSLNDAAERREILGLKRGETEVWYIRPDTKWRDTLMSAGYVRDGGEPKLKGWNITALPETHILLGKVASEDLEAIWQALQAENWSPQGEARNLILGKGLHHTSMMMGDVIVLPSGQAHMPTSIGFAAVGRIIKGRRADDLTGEQKRRALTDADWDGDGGTDLPVITRGELEATRAAQPPSYGDRSRMEANAAQAWRTVGMGGSYPWHTEVGASGRRRGGSRDRAAATRAAAEAAGLAWAEEYKRGASWARYTALVGFIHDDAGWWAVVNFYHSGA
jgi:hypothetical protein